MSFSENIIKLVASILFLIMIVSFMKDDYMMRHTERNCSITVTEKDKVDAFTFLIKGTDSDGNERTFQLDSDLVNAIYEENLKIETGKQYQFVVTGREFHIPLFTEYETIISIN